MNKIIPIIPCKNIKEQIKFYEDLGFVNKPVSNTYAVLKYGDLELNFYIYKGLVPSENPNMCFMQVEDVDSIYEIFSTNYQNKNNKLPRSGIPKITKIRDLKDDRRFTITDISGNTIFVGQPTQNTDYNFFRTIESNSFKKNYTILYDLLYSKEDKEVAYNMLEKFFLKDLNTLDMIDIDKAKLLLVAIDIQTRRKKECKDLCISLEDLYKNKKDNEDWQKIILKYHDIVND